MENNNKLLKKISENTGSEPQSKHYSNNHYLKEIAENTQGGGGGSGITIDQALDKNSTNPVQNKTIYSHIRSIGELNTYNFAHFYYNGYDINTVQGMVLFTMGKDVSEYYKNPTKENFFEMTGFSSYSEVIRYIIEEVLSLSSNRNDISMVSIETFEHTWVDWFVVNSISGEQICIPISDGR